MATISIDFLPYPFVIGFLILVGVCTARRRKGIVYLSAIFLFGLYLLAVLALVLFPMPFSEDWPRYLTWVNTAQTLARINWIPFNYGAEFLELNPRILLGEVLGNLLLTVPFGFGMAYFTSSRGKRAVLLALITGIALESAQLLVSLLTGYAYRSVDISDVILNALGVLAGVGVFWLLKKF